MTIVDPRPETFATYRDYGVFYAPDVNTAYLAIPKCANRSLKVWLVQNSAFARAFQETGADINPFIRQTLSIRVWREAGLPVDDRLADAIRFTFVRHPEERLISAFVDKIMWGVILSDPRMSAEIDYGTRALYGAPMDPQRLTFRDFCSVIAANPDDAGLNPHWRPQTWFVEAFQPTFVGRLETLDSCLAALRAVTGFNGVPPRLTASRPPVVVDGNTPLMDIPGAELAPYPNETFTRTAFFDDALRETVRRRFAADYARFGYD